MNRTREYRFFKKFLDQRETLINELLVGNLDKKMYIEDSYKSLKILGVEPYTIIDAPEKAIYNYQYYNMSAKYLRLQLNELKRIRKNNNKINNFKNQINNMYRKKDEATLALMDIVKFKNVEGYYIDIHSRDLKNKIFEVVFKDFDDVIFHSMNDKIMTRLKDNDVFIEGVKTSLIDNYINSKY